MEVEPAGQSVRRDYRVDFLRGLSILSVLVLHFNIAYRLIESPLGRFLPGPYLRNLVWNGNYGVTVFFAISGYLITSTSMRRFGRLDKVSPRVFYAFRFARIFPSLLLVLALVSGLALAGVKIFQDNEHVPLWVADLSVLTFWHNILMARFGYFNYCLNILWSLSVEEVFYLAFPMLCVLLRKTRWIFIVWIAAIVAGPVYRATHSHNEIEFLYGYLACFDAIAMGCCAAVLARLVILNSLTRNLLQAAAFILMLWIFLRAGIDSVPVWGTSLMALGAAVFLFAEGAVKASSGKVPTVADRLSTPIGWFGRHSYELYLFHIILLAGMMSVWTRKQIPDAAKPWCLLLFVTLSALVAWAVARFYSEPLNRGLRARLISRKRIAS